MKIVLVQSFSSRYLPAFGLNTLGINRSPGFDGISALHKPLLHVFNPSIVKGIFAGDLKIARVTPVFKGGDEKNLGNYRPVSVLPCFSRILERTMYNRL